VPYVFVESQKLLGRACGVSRPVISCSVLADTNPQIQTTLKKIKTSVEQLII